MIEKSNYKHNLTVPLEDDTVINGQGCGEVANMMYGLFHMSYNGCEMIALHNAMVLRGEKSCLREICLEMYPRCQSMSGFLGSNPYLLGSFFKRRKIPCRITLSYKDFFDSLDNVPVAVLSFWNMKPKKPFGGIHTVTVQKKGNRIIVYNRYNNRDYPYEYDSRYHILPYKSDFICGYLIEEGKKL